MVKKTRLFNYYLGKRVSFLISKHVLLLQCIAHKFSYTPDSAICNLLLALVNTLALKLNLELPVTSWLKLR